MSHWRVWVGVHSMWGWVKCGSNNRPAAGEGEGRKWAAAIQHCSRRNIVKKKEEGIEAKRREETGCVCVCLMSYIIADTQSHTADGWLHICLGCTADTNFRTPPKQFFFFFSLTEANIKLLFLLGFNIPWSLFIYLSGRWTYKEPFPLMSWLTFHQAARLRSVAKSPPN